MVLDHVLLHSYPSTPTTDSNTRTGMIWVTVNMPSAANRRGNVREFHIVWRVVTLNIIICIGPLRQWDRVYCYHNVWITITEYDMTGAVVKYWIHLLLVVVWCVLVTVIVCRCWHLPKSWGHAKNVWCIRPDCKQIVGCSKEYFTLSIHWFILSLQDIVCYFCFFIACYSNLFLVECRFINKLFGWITELLVHT